MARTKKADGRPASKPLNHDEQELLIQFARGILGSVSNSYRAISAIMPESQKYGATREPISRRAAQGYLQKALARIRHEHTGAGSNQRCLVIERSFELYERAHLKLRSNHPQAHRYAQECRELLKLQIGMFDPHSAGGLQTSPSAIVFDIFDSQAESGPGVAPTDTGEPKAG